MMTGFPTDAAGIKVEDRVLAVNGKAVWWMELAIPSINIRVMK